MTNKFWLFFRHADFKLQTLLRKDFGHVFILTKDRFEWIIFDPHFASFNYKILHYKITDDVVQEILRLNKDFSCVEICKKESVAKTVIFRLNILNCVGIAKYLIGLRKWYVQTPYSLYKYTSKHGKIIVLNKNKG